MNISWGELVVFVVVSCMLAFVGFAISTPESIQVPKYDRAFNVR